MKVTSVLRRYVSLGSVRQILQHPHLLLRLPSYIRQLKQYRFDERYQDGKNTKLRFYPCLNDICANQSISDYYFYQDTWAAQQVFGAKPEYVVDVGSSTTLVGYMAQFTHCISTDIRPVVANLDGLSSISGSVLTLPFYDNVVPCLTTMCVLEHIGLGRYGDPLNPRGTSEAVVEIARVIRPGGIVIYSVPVGRELLEFNANRRFSFRQALDLFQGWDIIQSTILNPWPEPYTSDKRLLEMSDPVACFHLRKPVR